MNVIAREVEFAPGAKPEIYHAVGQRDYLAILARTPDGRIPIVRQYRPALEAFTWELPAGLVEKDEDPAEACARELAGRDRLSGARGPLARRTGLALHRAAEQPHPFVLRRDRRTHRGFHAGAGSSTVALKTPAELVAMIKADEFVQQLHLGTLMLAELKGF